MSSQYNTEPPPTATVLLQTTAGPLTISLFANQTPLTTRNFLQNVLDGTYENNIFHRVSPGFVIQTGDPTGTGEGGENIYEDRQFESYDNNWARLLGRDVGEKIVFKDEVHSRLKFNRRGLVGMAKGSGVGGGYGSQFFITLADCRAQLDGRCTMFGRIEGDGIYNMVKIAEGELVEGTERPIYPEKILKAEVLEMPKGDAWQAMRPRQKVSERVVEEPIKKKVTKKKGGKVLLSFGGDEGEDEGAGVVVRPKKAKFNTALIEAEDETNKSQINGVSTTKNKSPSHPQPSRKEEPSVLPSQIPQKRKADAHESTPTSHIKSPSSLSRARKPSFHDPNTQLPLRDPELPSRSPSPSDTEPKTSKSTTNKLEAEIAALKASMRRDTGQHTDSTKHKKSALESLIPASSTRGRKRPRPGENNAKEDALALQMLNSFKSRLEGAETPIPSRPSQPSTAQPVNPVAEAGNDDEEAVLCDLHFIANCQSCSNWTDDGAADEADDMADKSWMSHALSFEKDRLGKDLTWKQKNEEELVVIDPREKERDLKSAKGKGKERALDRDRDKRRDREKLRSGDNR